ncbi:MAG: Ni-sirohydrochlorin a,c-diamide reductive cyclase catalytic subunit [archaeon]|nr:Ni-sirohydrochlorin a,c-diamide reductive cyclase catalytic subunit [archaeon]
MYTLRDLDVDVIIVHGPAGCGFMASRMLEETGVRVVTTAMKNDDLIFGGSESLISTLRIAEEKFRPTVMAVVGTCSSMIIGEDMESAIRQSGVSAKAFAVDCNGCMDNNTEGAIRAIDSAYRAGLISIEEKLRQSMLMTAATEMEMRSGMASRDYLSPVKGPTKLLVCRKIARSLKDGKKIACVMLAKKELAYRFSDIFLALKDAQSALGGKLFFIGNLRTDVGLPRIRGYAKTIIDEMSKKGVRLNDVVGGLDEYAIIGQTMREKVDAFEPDLTIIVGIPHGYPGYSTNDILITDQPRQLANYLSKGYDFAVGEISSHSMVMNTKNIIPLETGDTLREVIKEFV